MRLLRPKHSHVLLRIAFAAVLLAVLTHTRADPDLFGHVRFGHDIVTARSVHVADRYSFTSDRPWINHEWLSEAMMYLAYRTSGQMGLVALKLALLAAMLGAVAWTLRARGLPAGAQDLLVGLVVVSTFPQTNHVRPQLFSLALFAWLLVALLSSRRQHAALLWLIPIMAFWANVHGGWIVGAGTLMLWTGIGAFASCPRRDKLVAVAAAGAAIAVTVVNPFGWHLWTFLHDTVGPGRADISDWQPVFRLGAAYGLLWTLVAASSAAGMAVAVARRTIDLQASAIVLVLAVGSFRVNRLLAFFALSAVMLLGPQIATLAERRASGNQKRVSSWLASAAAVALALALVATGVTASARNLSCIRMDDAVFPEPEAASVITRYNLRGRMLTWFDYGQYAIWYFSPGITVSMDGRRETVYSEETIQRQLHFYYVPEDRRAILSALQPDYIWVPSSLDVAPRLASDGWKPMFSGPRSVILSKSEIPVDLSRPGSPASRCFPGP